MTPVLLLHGALGSSTQLNALKQALETGGFVVYSLNFSGHGGQPFRDTFGIETFATDVQVFIDKNNLRKVDIFGYSMGGYVALWYAYKNPDRAGRIITLGTKFDWSVESARKEIQKLDPEKIREKVPAFARLLEQRHQPHSWTDLVKKTSAMMLDLGNCPLINDIVLREITHRVLLLLGDGDDMADRAFTILSAQQLRSGKFLSLPHTPHPIEKVDLKVLSEIIVTFLRGT